MASDFATATTGTTQQAADVSYAAIINDDVLDALMAVVVTPPLLDQYDIMNAASLSVRIPKADKFTAADVAEGTELQNTALTTDSVTITSAEIGIQATVTDVLEVSDIPSAHGARLKQLGRALGDKLDIDICALFAGFSGAIGTTTVDLALADYLDGIYQLEVNDAAGLGSLVTVLHPIQTSNIRTALEAKEGMVYHNRTDRDLSKAQAGWFGNWFEIDFYQTTNVPTANGGDDRAGGLFVRDYALGMVQKWAARVEVMRWPSIRGFVLVATANYGVGEVEDAAGVKVISSAT